MNEMLAGVWDQIAGRTNGPLAARFVLQPLVAALLAARAGLGDAKAGRPPFLWAVVTDAATRRERLRSGWKDIGKVFVIACVLDGIYQVAAHRELRPLPTLIMATLLAIVPYALLRGPITRLAARGRRGPANA